MSFKPLLILAAGCAAGVIYQISAGGGPDATSEPGLDPTVRETVVAPSEDLSDHRRADESAEPRADIRATVSGMVRDHLGSPRASERIWILRPGERHPEVFGHAKNLLTVESDADGKFQFELGPEDEWHFSVGAIGDNQARTGVRRFEDGEQSNVEVVLGGAAHLTVVVESDAGIDTGVQPARIEIVRKTQAGDNRLIPFGAPPKPGFGVDPNAKPIEPDPWATSFAVALSLNEEVRFPKLKMGDTYRVAVVVGSRTAVSNESIVLQSGEDRVARCQLSESDGELALTVKLENAPQGSAAEPGFHWNP